MEVVESHTITGKPWLFFFSFPEITFLNLLPNSVLRGHSVTPFLISFLSLLTVPCTKEIAGGWSGCLKGGHQEACLHTLPSRGSVPAFAKTWSGGVLSLFSWPGIKWKFKTNQTLKVALEMSCEREVASCRWTSGTAWQGFFPQRVF